MPKPCQTTLEYKLGNLPLSSLAHPRLCCSSPDFSSVDGGPGEIEELLHVMNQPTLETVVKEEDDEDRYNGRCQ